MDADLGKSALVRIARLTNKPSKFSKKNDDKSAVAMLKKNEHPYRTGRPVKNAYTSHTRQLGCVFQDMEPPKSSSIFTEELRHAETNPTCEIHESYCTSH